MSTDQPRCLVVQDIIESILIEVLEVLPYRVVFSNYSDIVLSITFYNLSDLKKFYDLVSLKSLCDPSGYELLEDSFTIIKDQVPVGFGVSFIIYHLEFSVIS